MAENQTTGDGGESQPKSGSEDSGIDSYLKEFENKPPNPPSDGVSQVMERLEPVIQFASHRLEKENQELVDSAVNSAIEHFHEADELKSLPDQFVRGFMYDTAITDKAFSEAFNARESNPTAWKQALEKARESAVGLMSDIPDKKITEDMAAATASVRKVSTDVPDQQAVTNKDLNNMSDAQFAAHKLTLED